ncbi:hypothetical protein PFISCL1PPCAC_2165, partial [Pristionchus fissidentatus]
ALLAEMYHFDHDRLARIYARLSGVSGRKDWEIMQDHRNNATNDFEEKCAKLRDPIEAYNAYLINRKSIDLMFCPIMKKNASESEFGTEKSYARLLLFFFNGTQAFHPKDIDTYIKHLGAHFPNLVANTVAEISKECKDEHFVASILYSTRRGFTVDHTEQVCLI